MVRCMHWAHAGLGEGQVSSLSRGLGEGQREDQGQKREAAAPFCLSRADSEPVPLWTGWGGGEDNRGYGMRSSITQLPATRACPVSPRDRKGDRDPPAHPCYPGAESGP